MIEIQRLIEPSFNSADEGICFKAIKIAFTFLCNDTMDIRDLRRKLADPLLILDGVSHILMSKSAVADIDADIPTYVTDFTVFVEPLGNGRDLVVFTEASEGILIDRIEEIVSECCGRLKS